MPSAEEQAAASETVAEAPSTEAPLATEAPQDAEGEVEAAGAPVLLTALEDGAPHAEATPTIASATAAEAPGGEDKVWGLRHALCWVGECTQGVGRGTNHTAATDLGLPRR